MITITNAIEDILSQSEAAEEAVREGILDKTAFAKKIQAQVEEKTFKKVSINTIVVSLSRIMSKPLSALPLKPTVPIDSIEFITPIYDVNFEKTPELLKKLKELDISEFIKNGGQFAIIQGTSNVGIICSQELKNKVLTYFEQKPLYEKDNLTEMIIKHPYEVIDTPNSMYSIYSRFAMKRMNIAEIIPVGNEIIVSFPGKYLEEVIEAFKDYFDAMK